MMNKEMLDMLHPFNLVPCMSEQEYQAVHKQSGKDWEAQGKPLVWKEVEVYKEYVVALDTGYGQLALFRTIGGITQLLGTGKNSIIPANVEVAVLDRDYYGVGKYIWT